MRGLEIFLYIVALCQVCYNIVSFGDGVRHMSFLYILEGLRVPLLDKLLSALTFLGGEGIFIALAIIVFWCVSKRDGYYLIAAGVGGTVISQNMKILCRVPRPWIRDPNFTIVESAREGAGGYSFPSGHSQNAVVALGGTARFARPGWLKAVLWVLAAVVCFSRMYLGVHTPADVLVGAAIGLVLVFGLRPLFTRSEQDPRIIDWVFCGVFVFAAAGLFLAGHVPAGADPENLAEFQKNSYTMFGVAAAVLIGAPLERRFVRFETDAPWWAQILKCALGLAVVMGLRMALKSPLNALFQGKPIADAVRYMLMVLAAVLVWPLTFRWFSKGCPVSRRGRKVLKVVFIVLIIILVLVAILFWVVTRDSSMEPRDFPEAENDLITPLGVTMLSGHRAGGGVAPENTLMALETCAKSADYHLDVLEFDLHMTADGVLVLLHDGTLDRTSDAAEVFGETDVDVGSKTFEELQKLNMGAKFTAADGSTPFADLHGDAVPDDLRIISLDQALDYLEGAGGFRYIIEIKNGGDVGRKAADELYATLSAKGCLDRAVVGTFHNEITAYMDTTYPDMLRSAGVSEVVRFYFSALLDLDVEPDTFRFKALQIPTTDYVVNLGTSRVVNYAHEHGIAVQYWTINDPAQMARLQSIGADCVMTDHPDEGAKVLNQP